MYRNPSARKVIHLSTVLALGTLPWEIPWDLGIKCWGLSHTGGRSIIALIVVWCIHVNARGVTEN